MEKANNQQTKMKPSQNATLKAQNQRALVIKSSSNQTSKNTNKDNQTDTFPLNSIRLSGGFPYHFIHGTRVVESRKASCIREVNKAPPKVQETHLRKRTTSAKISLSGFN